MNEVTTNGNIQLCYGIEQAIRYATIPLWIMRMNRYKISTSSLSKRTSIKIKNPHSIGKKVSGCLTPDTFFTFWDCLKGFFLEMRLCFPTLRLLFPRFVVLLQREFKIAKRMETNIILSVALSAAVIVVVLALVVIIIYQRWRIGDQNVFIERFIRQNEEQRQKMRKAGIV